nr:MAG TPA: hypothetical protein [Bacteriophage sp.]
MSAARQTKKVCKKRQTKCQTKSPRSAKSLQNRKCICFSCVLRGSNPLLRTKAKPA